MLYSILRFILRKSVELHYLEVKGISLFNVPKDGPLLIAAGHPNSFLDAIIIAVLVERPIHFLARSDVFKKQWSSTILRKLNLIPIYRIQEGKDNLTKNEDTFKECQEILEQDGAILIFAEGISVIDKKIRPLKKGLARIAYTYWKKSESKKDLKIIPIGINYDRPIEFRSKIIVGCGEVVRISEYIDPNSVNTTAKNLNTFLIAQLREHTIEVDPEREIIYKAITELDSCYQENSLSRKIRIANQIELSATSFPNQILELKQRSEQAIGILKQYKLNFRKLKANHGINLIRLMAIILLSPLALVTFLLNAIPFFIGKTVANRKVKVIEFYASVRFAVNTVVWILWTLILTAILIQVSLGFLLFPILLYFSLKFYLWYYEEYKYLLASFRLRKLINRKSDHLALQGLVKSIYKIRASLNLSNS